MYLNRNVYIIDGAINAALYDLNKGELYQIGSKAKDLIHRIIENPDLKLNIEESEYIIKLCEMNILTPNPVKYHDIIELFEQPEIEFVWIEITNMCNLRCIHCYDEASCGFGQIMDLSDFEHIIDEISRGGIKKIQIIGGEPFVLKNKLKDYLDYCIGKFEYLEIFTNGTLINDEWIQYIKNNGIKIALSVYSYIETEHDKITRSKASWRKTNETIKKLSENNIEYRVKNVLMKELEIGSQNTELYKLSRRKDIYPGKQDRYCGAVP